MFLALVCLFFSCEKEGDLLKKDSVTIDTSSVLKYGGTFVPTSGISVQGNANVYVQEGNQYKLQLENITISDGPDLKVYLSKSDAPINFVNLGNFKGNGTSVYAIPSTLNLSEYQYVLIHCQQHNHLFAIAQFISK